MGNFIFCVVKQTSFTEKQCQKLDDTYEFDKIIKKEKPIFTKYNRSNLIYNIKYYIEYYNITNFNSLSLKKAQKRKKRLCMRILQKYTMSI